MGNHVPIKSITEGQEAKFLELQTAALRKSGLPSKLVQRVLERHGADLANEFLMLVRRRVESLGGEPVPRRVVIDRRYTSFQSAITSLARKEYFDEEVAATAPRSGGGEVEVHFFKLGRRVSDDDLCKEYASRGLVPANPYVLAALNEREPSFADRHPNGTHWKDADGEWCYVAFDNSGGKPEFRGVDVDRHNDIVSEWRERFWFAGVRK